MIETSSQKITETMLKRPTAEDVQRRRRADFIRDLRAFYMRKWGVTLRLPKLNGQKIDLYALYKAVAMQGGWFKVTSSHRWPTVMELFISFSAKNKEFPLLIDDDVLTTEYVIKILYMRYLADYETEQLYSASHDIDENDADSATGGTPMRSALRMSQRNGMISNETTRSYLSQFVPNHGQVMRAARDSERIAMVKGRRFAPFAARLCRSLESGLRNEVDFALNTCVLMSASGAQTLRLEGCPRVLDLLLLHAGISSQNYALLEEPIRKFRTFWSESIDNNDVLALALTPKGSKPAADLSCAIPPAFIGRDYSIRNAESQRILHVAAVVRNFSFEEFNHTFMASSTTLLRFLLGCANSDWASLRVSALDTLSNIAGALKLKWRAPAKETPAGAKESPPPDDEWIQLTTCLLELLSSLLAGPDKFGVIRALEIVGRLCSNECNEDLMMEYMEESRLELLVVLLSTRDIMLTVHLLETLYQVSELGPVANQRLSETPSAVNTFVSMLTTEAIDYGSAGLSGMKVVECKTTVPLSPQAEFHQPQPMRPPPHPMQRPPQTSSFPTLSSALQRQPPQPVRAPPRPLPPQPAPQQPPPPSVNGPMTGGGHLSIAVGHSSQQGASETVARTWLQNNCVTDTTVAMPSISRAELYGTYVRHVQAQNATVVSASLFATLVKAVFPTCESYDIAGSLHIRGIRLLQNRVQQQPQPRLPQAPPPVAATDATVSAAVAPPSLSVAAAVEQPVKEEPKPVIEPVIEKADTPCPSTPESSSASNSCASVSASSTKPRPPPKDSIPSNCRIEVCQAPQEAKELIEQTTIADEAQIILVENTAVGTDEAKPLVNGYAHRQPTTETPKIEAPTAVTSGNDSSADSSTSTSSSTNSGRKAKGAKGVMSNTTAHFAAGVQHVEQVMDWTPSPTNDEAMDSDEEAAEEQSEEDAAAKKGEAVAESKPRTPSPDIGHIAMNLNQCQANIQSMLHKPAVVKTPADTSGATEASSSTSETPKQAVKRPAPPAQQAIVTETPLSTGSATEAAKRVKISIPPPTAEQLLPVCEWNNCNQVFDKVSDVLVHVVREHIAPETVSCPCLWAHCDPVTPRLKWSLITHLQDVHCADRALRLSAIRRYEMSATEGFSNVPIPQRPPPHPGYARDAALSAIRRHCYASQQRELVDEHEGPVTKALRLTASLILRNIARYSPEGRRLLRRHESQLASLAFSRLEGSVTLSQLLSELHAVSTAEEAAQQSQSEQPQQTEQQTQVSQPQQTKQQAN